MWGAIDQLQEICRGRRIMVGFDRGGSYPKVFSELRSRGLDWVTYRRAPLTAPTVKPRLSWIEHDGRRHYLRVADEHVQLNDYGLARQITLYDHDRVALQILTSDLKTPAARLAHILRCRWCIENAFKYLEDHHGLHWLADYEMTLAPDTRLIANPARVAARADLRACKDHVADLERQIGALTTTTTTTVATARDDIAKLRETLSAAHNAVRDAKATLKPIPAKVPATSVNPDAELATPRTNRRALQTVCRLLAYNAEVDLARALNTYLQDPNEYRAITRHLLHQPGQITYTPTSITVTISQPNAPRVARALDLLTDQLNHDAPRLAGDNRKITYQTAKP